MKKEIKSLIKRNFGLYILCTIFMGVISLSANAQIKVSGFIVDSKSGTPIIGAGMQVRNMSDSMQTAQTLSELDGSFILTVPSAGKYRLNVYAEGFLKFKKEIIVSTDPTNLGNVGLIRSNVRIDTIQIHAVQTRAEQKGDTTQFHADAFKVNTDATAQDLIQKLPGVTVDNTGAVKAHGENVQRVLVDGKPYFGDDVNIAMKNVPADVVDKVQIFDMMSDQARFTGFDDGNTTKTINFITKAGMARNDFGKIFAGYGTDNTYNAGWSLNEFKGTRKISFLGLFNNINQQNFSAQDLLGVMNGSGSGGRRGGGGSGGGNSFMVGQQSGITTTSSLGLNYTDVWFKKVLVTGSYFFNAGDIQNNSIDNRTYFSKLMYNEYDTSHTKNYNHRANLKLEYAIDERNSILVQPSFTYQKNISNTSYPGQYLDSAFTPLTSTRNTYIANSHGYTFSNTALFRHKLAKTGRTISLNVDNSFNNKTIDGNQNSSTTTYSGLFSHTTDVNQSVPVISSGFTVKPTITYTEPLTKRSMGIINYALSYSQSTSDKKTFNYNDTFGDYTKLDTGLSNTYKSTYIAHIAGLGYRLRFDNNKANFMVSANYQHATLDGEQTLPNSVTVNKSFDNILPTSIFMYKFSEVSSIRVFYRTSTSTPSLSQLQNVVDNSNPLQLNQGNAELKQSYTHNLFTRMGFSNNKKARNLFLFLFGSITQNYVANSTYTATRDSVLPGHIILHKGSQLITPLNINGNVNARSNITYSFPIEKLKSTLNLNNGFTFARTPGYLNNILNITNTYNFSQGVTLSSNISKEVDFTLSYTASYNIVNTTIVTGVNNNYFNHLAVAKLNWIIWKGIFINTEADQSLYQTTSSSSYNQNFILWNVSVGDKFLKRKNADIRLTAFDILNQNVGVSRNITDVYVENIQSKVLHRYIMLTFTYNLKGSAPNMPRMPGMPSGAPPISPMGGH